MDFNVVANYFASLGIVPLSSLSAMLALNALALPRAEWRL